MTRHKIMIRKWKYDEVGEKIQRGTSRDPNEISAPLEHLEEFMNSDYKITEHLSEVYGWKVVTNSGERIGTLKDFLFDRNQKRIRYLVVNLAKDVIVKKDYKEILIPIGMAKLDEQERRIIILKNLSSEELGDIPKYKNIKSLAIEDEKRTLSIFSSKKKDEISYTPQNFYSHDEFSEGIFFGYDEK